MDAFKGKYERTSADKYEEMLKELDVNFLLRKAATVSTPGKNVFKNYEIFQREPYLLFLKLDHHYSATSEKF